MAQSPLDSKCTFTFNDVSCLFLLPSLFLEHFDHVLRKMWILKRPVLNLMKKMIWLRTKFSEVKYTVYSSELHYICNC
jgi:hypothetical protein